MYTRKHRILLLVDGVKVCWLRGLEKNKSESMKYKTIFEARPNLVGFFAKRFAGWDPRLSQFEPFVMKGELRSSDVFVEYVLDSVTAAVEAGILVDEFVPQALFSSEELYRQFVQYLFDFGEDRWMNERHFHAFLKLFVMEAEVCSYQRLAETLAELEYADTV